MIPRLANIDPVHQHYQDFLQHLLRSGFAGTLSAQYAQRIVSATDNSLYQVLPQGIVYPNSIEDLQHLTRLSQHSSFTDIVLSPRGGGTGTNGQSLSDGLVVDLSRHMNRILEINASERWARVQAGVVKDQLNAALKPHGLFFAPELSTSNRATLGGMINTDASGQGSVRYGKTRDHVRALTTVLMDGSLWHSQALSEVDLHSLMARKDRIGQIHRLLHDIEQRHGEQIQALFPRLNRCLTGYDLAHIRDNDHRFNANNILCGSEGTLGFIAEATVSVLPIPRHTALVAIAYDSFDTSLRDAQALMAHQPTSIETIDSLVLRLARQDASWPAIAPFFPNTDAQGINLVEFAEDDPNHLHQQVQALTQALLQGASACLSHTVAWGEEQVAAIWTMRKRAVGLLGNAQGEARPVPFVEDTAVPPKHLADFIAQFRALLDQAQLEYGMFGHVDAGVLHVRPRLDMKDPQQAALIRPITEQVVALVKQYGGVLWGEHGKGVRSEFSPQFFGALYPCLQQIKQLFDPHNQLNPGKIATPDDRSALWKIDAVPLRGQWDRQIHTTAWQQYADAVHCNGNGACYNYDPQQAMCPSWKGTLDRRHSPKGRAALIREWLRLLSQQGSNAAVTQAPAKRFSLHQRVYNSFRARLGQYDFSHEVNEAMQGCLACKSCTHQCPIKIDVPAFRSRFLALYYGRYLRPAKDYLVGYLESLLPMLLRLPRLYNAILAQRPVAWLLRHGLGMVDSPPLSLPTLAQVAQTQGILYADPKQLQQLSLQQRAQSVLIVQDAFTSHFDTPVVAQIINSLKAMGFTPYLIPYRPNGKPLHVHGFLQQFERIAQRQAEHLSQYAPLGIDMVGIDPSMTLAYHSEYPAAQVSLPAPVQLLQHWLHTRLLQQPKRALLDPPQRFYLLPHCSEKTQTDALAQWQGIFAHLGAQLDILPVGCCGMAGTYGHEARHQALSAHIYQLSWAQAVQHPDHQGRLLATGYSCRSQAKRLDQVVLQHPLQALLTLIQPPSLPEQSL